MNVPGIATGTRALTTAADAAGGPFFQQVIPLTFNTDGSATGIALNVGGTVLRGNFQRLDYDARASSETTLQARVRKGQDKTVIVELDAPRQVNRIKLSTSKAGDPGGKVELYRLDQEVRAEKPTATAKNNSTFRTDFTDARFGVRFHASDGYKDLNSSDVQGVFMRGYPTGPRLGIADPAKPEAVTWFWQQPGELGKVNPDLRIHSRFLEESVVASVDVISIGGVGVLGGAEHEVVSQPMAAASQFVIESPQVETFIMHDPLSPVPFDAGAAFAQELERYLSGLGSPLPSPLQVNLVIASDAPCNVDVDAATLPYQLVLEALPSHQDKEVLRFGGDTVGAEQIVLTLPATASMTRATVKTAESVRDDHIVSGTTLVPNAPLPQQAGVALGSESWAAQSFTPANALSASGLALGIVPLAADTELEVEIQEDGAGQPSGKTLFAGKLKLGQVGMRSWMTLFLNDPVVLPSQPHWLLVRAVNGLAVWLAQNAESSIQILERTSATSPWNARHAVKQLQTFYQLFSRVGGAQSDPVHLSVGTQPVISSTVQDGFKTYDFTSPLASWLQAQPAGNPKQVPLKFTVTGPGTITVYAPRIEYNL